MEKGLIKSSLKFGVKGNIEKPIKPDNSKCKCGKELEPVFIEPEYYELQGTTKLFSGTNKWFIFQTCDECNYKKEIQEKKEEVEKSFAEKLERSGLFPKQLKCIFNENDNSKMINICKKFCDKPDHNIFIWGSSGIGKTHLLSCMANELIRNNEIRFFRMIDLLNSIRAKMLDADSDADYFIEKLSKGNYALFLDDIGAEKPSETVKEKIYSLIDLCILQERKGIVITSNMSIKELANHLNDRIASRIEELCTVYNLTGENKRLNRSDK